MPEIMESAETLAGAADDILTDDVSIDKNSVENAVQDKPQLGDNVNNFNIEDFI